jgi:TPR repeat protein
MKTKVWLSILVLACVLGAGGFWYFAESPPKLPATPSDAPVPDVEALSWEELRTEVDQMERLEVRQQGVLLFQSGDPDQAFLMFKKAANKGDGWSARAIGLMYDPATFAAGDFAPEKTAFSKPNPRKALQWYDKAIEQGDTDAQRLRERLLAHLREAAAEGDAQAQRILKRVQ